MKLELWPKAIYNNVDFELKFLKRMMKKDDGTHKPRRGELVLNQIKQNKNRVLKKLSFQGSYHKLLLKPIFNQSPLT